MAIDERARHKLYLRLEEVLGPEDARVLMEHLPPVGWGDVATKRDLDLIAVATKRDLDLIAVATKRDLDLKLDSLKHELTATFRGELIRQTRTMVFALIGALATMGGLVFAAAHLT